MDVGAITEKGMAMSPEIWARHANPWSGWTRVPVLPVLALAVWSRAWFGWASLAILAVLLVWIWINPRVFPKPKSTDNWMSRGVLGERVWLNRKAVPIPAHHARWAILLSVVSGIGIFPLAWGLWQFEIWPVLLGLTLSMGGKLWFLDRMVWLYADMAEQHPEYRPMLY